MSTVTHGINFCLVSNFYLQFLKIYLLKTAVYHFLPWILRCLIWFIMPMCSSLCLHNKNQYFSLNINHTETISFYTTNAIPKTNAVRKESGKKEIESEMHSRKASNESWELCLILLSWNN